MVPVVDRPARAAGPGADVQRFRAVLDIHPGYGGAKIFRAVMPTPSWLPDQPRNSHHLPGEEIPEDYWLYRFLKRQVFFGMGAHGYGDSRG